jgi:hypothetical protein
MKREEIILRLRDDVEYYGTFGRQFRSNSDVRTLLTNPRNFGIPEDDSKVLAEGRYFHQCILEPHKAVDTPFVECSNRNSKIYKDHLETNGIEFCMLKSELEAIQWLVSIIKGNVTFFDEIYKKGNLYEEPTIGDIKGVMWKGKADIVTDNSVIDLKTTSDINDFRWSARKYNYDSQCYLYQQLFGKPLVFYVIDKNTGALGIFRPSESFIQRGESKVDAAMEVYNKYFGATPSDDIINYYIDEILE